VAAAPPSYKKPTPDEILQRLQQLRRGRLKIYLGAAPGVGKTYTMLADAQEQRARGVDVVVGVVDCHARPATEAMIGDLPVLPTKSVDYHGLTLQELDVDAVRARDPDLVLIDELAHTNAPGSTHIKRYEDVLDLLAAGINVWSTLNVQHLESLNDTVYEITRVRVKETVPDSVLDRASEIRLIDLDPDALIDRVKDGRVYRQAEAERALKGFFRRGNLTALREMALRALAEATDRRLEEYMAEHRIDGPWAARDRILACASTSPNGQRLIRRAYRTAKRLRGSLYVLYVQRPGERLDEGGASALQRNLDLATRLGAHVERVSSSDAAGAIVAYARSIRATQIVLGESLRPSWRDRMRGSIVERVLRATHDVDVLVVASPKKDEPRGG
jgi:two-component system sensor histidine kinase KdpD